LTGAKILAGALQELGIERIYFFPGASIAPLLGELTKIGIELVCARNEQGAGFAALGAARITRKPQVVIVTSGPGAINLLTPIADAFFDSVPIIAITGQVESWYITQKTNIRQIEFQQTDVIRMYEPVTRNQKVLLPGSDLRFEIFELYDATIKGRPAPVLADLPLDTQLLQCDIQESELDVKGRRFQSGLQAITRELAMEIHQKICQSEKPVVLVGNGVLLSDATKEIRDFCQLYQLPVVSSLPGIGAIPSDDPFSVGFIGQTGEFHANLSIFHSDLVIIIGASLKRRQIGHTIDYLQQKKLIRIDIDRNELNAGQVKCDVHIHADIKRAIKEYLVHAPPRLANTIKKEWIRTIDNWRSKYYSAQFYTDYKLSTWHVVNETSKQIVDNVIVASGVGVHQQLVGKFFRFNYPQRVWMTSSGNGTMGFDLPALIGAMIEGSGRYRYGILFVGDGSFQMNIQELATLKDLNLPIKIFVLDNQQLGIVSQCLLPKQEFIAGTRNKSNPSFSQIAVSYGLKGYDLMNKEDIDGILSKVLGDTDPCLVHCHIDDQEIALPIQLKGQKMNEMYPFHEG
jgi:acetolactate synthase-1/2/3 large subunit